MNASSEHTSPSRGRATPHVRVTVPALAFACACIAGAGCHETTTAPAVRSVILRFDSSTVFYGDTIRAFAVATGDSATVHWPRFTWTSSDTTVAVVDSAGVVLGVNPGDVTIAAAFEGKRDEFALRVVMHPAMADPVKFVAGSSGFWLCAIAAGGIPYCAPNTTQGSAPVFARLPGFAGVPLTSFSSGDSPYCGFGGGSLYCWGSGDTYLYGSRVMPQSVPAALPANGIRFSQAVVGGHTTACGVGAADSIVYCWGHFHSSLLGHDAVTDDTIAKPVGDNLRGVLVNVTNSRACAIDLERHVQCWGSGSTGNGFAPSNAPAWMPRPLLGGHSFTTISLGETGGCGLNTDGAAYCWGENPDGALGGGTLAGPIDATPVQVVGDHRFASVSAIDGGNCGITGEGDLYCWGLIRPLLIRQHLGAARATPHQIAHGIKFSALAKNFGMLCGVTTEGSLLCW